jgi:hypothetical protein
MPLVVLAVAPLVVLALLALIPVSLVLRSRAGSARQRARGWLAGLSLLGFAASSGLVLLVAGLTSFWVPGAFRYTLAGLAAGCALGLLGLALTRWEAAPDSLHFTPSRWLVLAVVLVVSARMLYGIVRAWLAFRATPSDLSWLAASGAAGSMAAGAVVLGYYLAYWTGVRLRVSRHRRTGR